MTEPTDSDKFLSLALQVEQSALDPERLAEIRKSADLLGEPERSRLQARCDSYLGSLAKERAAAEIERGERELGL